MGTPGGCVPVAWAMMRPMTYEIATLTSADGTALHSTWWQPTEPPAKAVVAHIHGLGEHSGRHFHVAQRLADAGYAVAQVDLRGHGRSAGVRGHTPFPGAMDDVDALLEAVRQREPELPVFLYGHSLGGLIVLNYALRRSPDLAGLVATSSGLRSPVLEQRVKMTAAKLLGSAVPWVTMPTGLDDAGLSRDQAVIDAYRADPYVHGKASTALAKDGAEAADYVLAHADQLRYPVLLIHGSADPIAYARGTEELAAEVPDVTVHIYDGLMHETHNEPEKAQVLDDIVSWLDAHVS